LFKKSIHYHSYFIFIVSLLAGSIYFFPKNGLISNWVFIVCEVLIFFLIRNILKIKVGMNGLKRHAIVIAFGWFLISFGINAVALPTNFQLNISNYIVLICGQIIFMIWQPYFEEVLFRRCLFGNLFWSSKISAFILPIGAFSIFHVKGTWLSFLLVVVVSIQLCFLYQWTNAVVNSFFVHVAFNFGFIFKALFLTFFSLGTQQLISVIFGGIAIVLIFFGNFLISKTGKLLIRNNFEIKVYELVWLLVIGFIFLLSRINL
jgi:membrane protease YdiL (CAAX protease family)